MTTKHDLYRLIDALPDTLVDEAGRRLTELHDPTKSGPPPAEQQKAREASSAGEQPAPHNDLSLRRE